LAALYEAAGDPLAALRYVVRGLVYQSDDKDLLDRRERYLWSLPLDGPSTTAEALRGLVEPAHCIRRAREILDDRRSDTTWLEVAEHLLVLAERVDPDNLTARVNLARARLRLGDRDAAVAGYESVRAAKPTGLFQGDAPEAWQLANQALGELYLECGRPKDAVACLLDFRDSPKAGAATLFKLGQAYEEMRDIKRARSYYTQVTGYEGNPLVWQAREAIDRLTNGTNNADPSAQ
jgi:tetratricopeptide (TPR) repeat protein